MAAETTSRRSNTVTDSPRNANRVDRLMEIEPIASFLVQNIAVTGRTRNAIEFLIEMHGEEVSDEDILKTVGRLLKPLRDERITAFFSYKYKDQKIAEQLDEWFRDWSGQKLQMNHMATLDVGTKWREQIEKDIPASDWFLLLMPGPEVERDWQLYEAGYFRGSGGLGKRLVCLHHPDKEVTDALGLHQSVPADRESVERFVERFLVDLFLKPNWIPGFPPVNPDFATHLSDRARFIAELIRPPSLGRRFLGPYMQVEFTDASAVRGWPQLAAARVKHANADCRRLLGFTQGAQPMLLGEWLGQVRGAGRDEGWVRELTTAVQALAYGRVPSKDTVFSLPEGRINVRIFAQTRRTDGTLQAVDVLFSGVEPSVHGSGVSINPHWKGRDFAVEEDLVFVLMPFREPWSDAVWNLIKQIVFQNGFQCQRADEKDGRIVMDDIWEGLNKARLVIADLSSKNPNVTYEVGLADVLGKEVMLLSQTPEDVPFDFLGIRLTTYENNIEGVQRLTDALKARLDRLTLTATQNPPPVAGSKSPTPLD